MGIKVEGVVTKVFSRKVGKGSTFSFIVNDDGTWYSCGFVNPKLTEGDSISFEYKEEEYAPNKFSNKVDTTTITKEEGRAPTLPKKSTRPSGGGSTKVQENWDARAKYWENKELLDVVRQNTISYQAAFNTAMAQLTAMCKCNPEVYDYLVGNTPKTHKKPGVQIENFTNQVEALANEFLSRFIQGDAVVKQLQEDVNVVGDAIDHTDGGDDLDD